MDFHELAEQRREKWHANGNPIRTFEAARDFVDDVGLCPMYPEPRSAPAASFIAAWFGRSDRLPTARSAFAHADANEAEAMKLRLVRDSAAFEWPLDDSVLLIAPAVFSFFYALAADRDGRQQPAWAAGQKLSKLARDAWTEIQQARTPLGEEQLRQQLGKGISEAALRRALHELWQRLRIMRVDRTAGSGDIWDALSRCALQPIREAEQLSVPSALSALLSKYLYATVAAEPKEVEQFFSPLVARSKVRDATSALLAAREISPIQVGSHSMLQLTPAKAPFKPKQVNVAAPAAVPRRVALRPSSGRPQR